MTTSSVPSLLNSFSCNNTVKVNDVQLGTVMLNAIIIYD